MPLHLLPIDIARDHGHAKLSAIGCENGRHSAIGGSKIEINGVVHATCRHCGCELMRLGASRRWFRTGEMGG